MKLEKLKLDIKNNFIKWIQEEIVFCSELNIKEKFKTFQFTDEFYQTFKSKLETNLDFFLFDFFIGQKLFEKSEYFLNLNNLKSTIKRS